MAKDKGKEFHGAESICMCSHTGNGENSQHQNIPTMGLGNGRCLVTGCGCIRFAWARSTKKFYRYLNNQKKGE